MNDGTKELYDETSGMDKKIQEEIEEILGNIGGEETERYPLYPRRIQRWILCSLSSKPRQLKRQKLPRMNPKKRQR